MLRFVLRRSLLAVLTLFVISVLTFLLFFAVPADPASLMCPRNCSTEQLQLIHTRLGLDKPLWNQYTDWIGGIIGGRTYGSGDWQRECHAPCLGYSFRTDEPVTKIIGRAFPITLSIALGTWILEGVIGVGLGVIAALRKNTWVDKGAISLSLLGASMPSFFFAAILLFIFVYSTHILPFPSFTSFFDNPLAWAGGLVLPWFTLAILNSTNYSRMQRAQMLETLGEDFIRSARAKGLKKGKVMRHALRAAITPSVTISGLSFGGLLGGAVITETIFGMPGMGQQSILAVANLNFPIVMATVVIAAVFIVVANIIVDILYASLDPRVRLS